MVSKKQVLNMLAHIEAPELHRSIGPSIPELFGLSGPRFQTWSRHLARPCRSHSPAKNSA
jgi:hypothetical protein